MKACFLFNAWQKEQRKEKLALAWDGGSEEATDFTVLVSEY